MSIQSTSNPAPQRIVSENCDYPNASTAIMSQDWLFNVSEIIPTGHHLERVTISTSRVLNKRPLRYPCLEKALFTSTGITVYRAVQSMELCSRVTYDRVRHAPELDTEEILTLRSRELAISSHICILPIYVQLSTA